MLPNLKPILQSTQSFQWSGASNIISRLYAWFDRTPYHCSTGAEGVLCSTYCLKDCFLAWSKSLLRATCHTKDFLECISAHTDDAARMYGLEVAGDVRNPPVVLLLHASDLLDAFPMAMLWLHFCPFPFNVRSVRRSSSGLSRHLFQYSVMRWMDSFAEFWAALANSLNLKQYVCSNDRPALYIRNREWDAERQHKGPSYY